MSVSIGSFSDPQGLEGLAHFLGTLISPKSCAFSIINVSPSYHLSLIGFCNNDLFLFFLEHMLFYASAKYPEEDSYSKYITEVIHIYTYSGEVVLLFVSSVDFELSWCIAWREHKRVYILWRDELPFRYQCWLFQWGFGQVWLFFFFSFFFFIAN